MPPRCLQCRYIRAGIAAELPCPECGEPAPPPEWIVLHGRSTPSDPRWGIAGVVALAAGLATTAFLGWRTGQWSIFLQVATFGAFGTFALTRLVRVLRRQHEGGDICWIIKPDGVEARGLFGTRKITYAAIEWVLFERGWSRHLACVTLSPRANIDGSLLPSIWIDQREHDARAIHALLRERTAAATASVGATRG